MTYVREVTKLTIITLAYIDYFYQIWHWSPWRSGSVGGSWIHVSRVQISVTTCFFFCFVLFFFYFFYLFFYVFFLSLLLQCKFANSTLLSLLSFSKTPYDAQASSAFSALIIYSQNNKKKHSPHIKPPKNQNRKAALGRPVNN